MTNNKVLHKPTGFVVKCRCGAVLGAMDFERTNRTEAGKLLGEWLLMGCTVEPRFTGRWSAQIESCRCNEALATTTQSAEKDAVCLSDAVIIELAKKHAQAQLSEQDVAEFLPFWRGFVNDIIDAALAQQAIQENRISNGRSNETDLARRNNA